MTQEEFLNAARSGNETEVRRLLVGGVDIHSRNERKQTALILAAAHGHRDLVRFLIENNADINASDAGGLTALRVATAFERNQVVRLLLSKGADTELSDERGQTPLHIAAGMGSPVLVQLLVKHGADIGAIDDNADTPLALARSRGYPQVMELLGDSESSSAPSRILEHKGQDNLGFELKSAQRLTPGPMFAFSPDSRLVASAGADTVYVGDLATQTTIRRLTGAGIGGVAFSPDTSTCQLAVQDSTGIRVLDPNSGVVSLAIAHPHTDYPSLLTFSPDARQLATAHAPSAISIWNAKDGSLLHNITLDADPICGLTFSPDSNQLATAAPGPSDQIKFWNAQTGACVKTIGRPSWTGSPAVAFSRDGRLLVTYIGTFEIRDAETNAVVKVMRMAFDDSVSRLSMAWSPTTPVLSWIYQMGDQIVVGFYDEEIWERLHRTVDEPLSRGVGFSPDGKLLAYGLGDHVVVLKLVEQDTST